MKNWTDYNDEEEPIPFRRRVFCSSLDGRPIKIKNVETLIKSLEDRRHIPNWILRLANDRDGWDKYPWGSHVWTTLYQQLKDANVRCWPALYTTQPTYEIDKKSYSITGFAWAFKTWILESFRATMNNYYTRYRRLPRIVAWSSKNKFYRNMLKPFLYGQLPIQRLVPDEIEARSRWWVSSMAYFDGCNIEDERIPCHLNRNNYFEVPSEMYREFNEQMRGYKQRIEKSDNIDLSGFQSYQGVPSSFHTLANSSSFFNMTTPLNWQTPIPSYLGTPNSQPPIPSHPGTSNWQNPMTPYSPNFPHTIPSHPHDAGLLNPVYLSINAGGVHWVNGAINLVDSIFYVFDSTKSESRMLMLEQQIRDWTPVIGPQYDNKFNSPPRRSFIGGMVATVDPVELERFSTNQGKLLTHDRLKKWESYDIMSNTMEVLANMPCKNNTGVLMTEVPERGNVSPTHLSFDDVEDRTRVQMVVTGAEIGDADLKRTFKEAIMAHAGVVSNVPINLGKECEGMVREPLARKHRQAPRDQGFYHPRFNLNSLTKLPKEILASEPQLNLQPPRSMQLTFKKEKQDKYCDYHAEKGHYTNDCFQLGRQLEMALESGKLNHLIKDGIHGSGSIDGSDVLALLREFEPCYKVAFEGPPDGFGSHHLRVLKVKEEASGKIGGQSEYQPIERSPRKSGFEETNISQPSVPGSTSNNRGKPVEAMQELAQNIAKEKYGCFRDDEEKTAFYTDQGTYCYMKMPFGLQNARSTYQRVVDTAFQSQIGRNLEAYVDDMVIKSNNEKVLIEDITETFDNLQRINMKLNQKKCSFGVKEGKFMGYMITSKGIQANLKKTKAITDMQSPQTLKEIKGVSRNEKGYSRAPAANHPSKGGNVIHICSNGNESRMCRTTSRKKEDTVSDTLRKEDAERGQKELCTVGKIGPVIVAHVQEATKANYVIREIHIESCEMHIGARYVLAKAIRQGYYWPTLHRDARNVTQKCDSCQVHAPVPRHEHGGDHPQENGLVERANKSLMEGIKARLGRERAGWVDKLPNVLWANRTSLKQSNGETPFGLTYESEAVIPVKIGMPTHRTMMIREEENEDELRLNMDLPQERREATSIREAKYKTKIK
uniref:Reverse transcriptase domain-containing protein n=1 Tax=Tanacetum cinerariifolium TaxID=118510 RepID=A0A6L2NXG4_TANCI|nr:reverse transcriptase domain-containing protein [Tanacetum cinerariifolium]